MYYKSLGAAFVTASFWAATPVIANDADALFEALGMPEIIEIMRAEGVDYGAQIGTDLFPTRVNAAWSATVETIYNPEIMQARVKADFVSSLKGDDVAGMLDFFTSDPGRTFAGLEVSARRAVLDDAVQEASDEMAAMAVKDNTERFQLLDRFVQTNDLIETNVVGALNSNYEFYMGLMAGGAFDDALTEEQILSDVWDQEADIRANTAEWVYSFLMLAYDPASDADIETYITFSESEAGKQLNTTLFDAFDDLFDDISYTLGLEAARMMAGAEL